MGVVEKGEGERGKGRELRDWGHPKVNREAKEIGGVAAPEKRLS